MSGKRPDGATREALRAATTEQLRKHSRAGRSQTAFSPKTLRAAGLLSVAGVGSFLTARCGDARNSPPWPQPKSLAAAPLVVSKQALTDPRWDMLVARASSGRKTPCRERHRIYVHDHLACLIPSPPAVRLCWQGSAPPPQPLLPLPAQPLETPPDQAPVPARRPRRAGPGQAG